MKKQSKLYRPTLETLNPAILHYGKETPYIGKETDFQKSSAALVAYHGLAFAYHVPNESRRQGRRKGEKATSGNIERMMLKAQGVLSGVADWCVPYKTSYGHPGSYIELKAHKGSLSQDQVKFLNAAFEQGYFCAVVWNLDSFEGLLKELYPKQRFVKPKVEITINLSDKYKEVNNRLSEFIGILKDAPGTFENDLKMLSE